MADPQVISMLYEILVAQSKYESRGIDYRTRLKANYYQLLKENRAHKDVPTKFPKQSTNKLLVSLADSVRVLDPTELQTTDLELCYGINQYVFPKIPDFDSLDANFVSKWHKFYNVLPVYQRVWERKKRPNEKKHFPMSKRRNVKDSESSSEDEGPDSKMSHPVLMTEEDFDNPKLSARTEDPYEELSPQAKDPGANFPKHQERDEGHVKLPIVMNKDVEVTDDAIVFGLMEDYKLSDWVSTSSFDVYKELYRQVYFYDSSLRMGPIQKEDMASFQNDEDSDYGKDQENTERAKKDAVTVKSEVTAPQPEKMETSSVYRSDAGVRVSYRSDSDGDLGYKSDTGVKLANNTNSGVRVSYRSHPQDRFACTPGAGDKAVHTHDPVVADKHVHGSDGAIRSGTKQDVMNRSGDKQDSSNRSGNRQDGSNRPGNRQDGTNRSGNKQEARDKSTQRQDGSNRSGNKQSGANRGSSKQDALGSGKVIYKTDCARREPSKGEGSDRKGSANKSDKIVAQKMETTALQAFEDSRIEYMENMGFHRDHYMESVDVSSNTNSSDEVSDELIGTRNFYKKAKPLTLPGNYKQDTDHFDPDAIFGNYYCPLSSGSNENTKEEALDDSTMNRLKRQSKEKKKTTTTSTTLVDSLVKVDTFGSNNSNETNTKMDLDTTDKLEGEKEEASKLINVKSFTVNFMEVDSIYSCNDMGNFEVRCSAKIKHPFASGVMKRKMEGTLGVYQELQVLLKKLFSLKRKISGNCSICSGWNLLHGIAHSFCEYCEDKLVNRDPEIMLKIFEIRRYLVSILYPIVGYNFQMLELFKTGDLAQNWKELIKTQKVSIQSLTEVGSSFPKASFHDSRCLPSPITLPYTICDTINTFQFPKTNQQQPNQLSQLGHVQGVTSIHQPPTGSLGQGQQGQTPLSGVLTQTPQLSGSLLGQSSQSLLGLAGHPQLSQALLTQLGQTTHIGQLVQQVKDELLTPINTPTKQNPFGIGGLRHSPLNNTLSSNTAQSVNSCPSSIKGTNGYREAFNIEGVSCKDNSDRKLQSYSLMDIVNYRRYHKAKMLNDFLEQMYNEYHSRQPNKRSVHLVNNYVNIVKKGQLLSTEFIVPENASLDLESEESDNSEPDTPESRQSEYQETNNGHRPETRYSDRHNERAETRHTDRHNERTETRHSDRHNERTETRHSEKQSDKKKESGKEGSRARELKHRETYYDEDSSFVLSRLPLDTDMIKLSFYHRGVFQCKANSLKTYTYAQIAKIFGFKESHYMSSGTPVNRGNGQYGEGSSPISSEGAEEASMTMAGKKSPSGAAKASSQVGNSSKSGKVSGKHARDGGNVAGTGAGGNKGTSSRSISNSSKTGNAKAGASKTSIGGSGGTVGRPPLNARSTGSRMSGKQVGSGRQSKDSRSPDRVTMDEPYEPLREIMLHQNQGYGQSDNYGQCSQQTRTSDRSLLSEVSDNDLPCENSSSSSSSSSNVGSASGSSGSGGYKRNLGSEFGVPEKTGETDVMSEVSATNEEEGSVKIKHTAVSSSSGSSVKTKKNGKGSRGRNSRGSGRSHGIRGGRTGRKRVAYADSTPTPMDIDDTPMTPLTGITTPTRNANSSVNTKAMIITTVNTPAANTSVNTTPANTNTMMIATANVANGVAVNNEQMHKNETELSIDLENADEVDSAGVAQSSSNEEDSLAGFNYGWHEHIVKNLSKKSFLVTNNKNENRELISSMLSEEESEGKACNVELLRMIHKYRLLQNMPTHVLSGLRATGKLNIGFPTSLEMFILNVPDSIMDCGMYGGVGKSFMYSLEAIVHNLALLSTIIRVGTVSNIRRKTPK
ncbi:hypothetical protein MACK_001304 [Theileria orientalis]|uniref:Uncharacterized protein n=1 Tax=Theileria orientalis TaxID=68886 RepID=A0A976QV80_THEOR|nr:hypothetical protein MACK_001304 [Theileria orientalis]